jgi:TnsA endonuclease N terminal/TnsA endonuclease C terminal
MARRKYRIDEKRAAKFVKEGRGQGEGAGYKPWLTIQDVPSRGRSHRLLGISTGRIHHLLSDLELDLFLLLDWQPSTVDLREQFPLDVQETQDIAELMKVRHPRMPGTPQPMVMTTDLVQDLRTSEGEVTRAFAVKSADDLAKPRTLQKLEIEWRFWRGRRIHWSIVTRAELPKRLIGNIAWVHPFFSPAGIEDRVLALIPLYLDEVAVPRRLSLARFCAGMDTRHGLPHGSSLTLMRHLLAIRKVVCDMKSVTLSGSLPMSELKINDFHQKRRLA